MKLPLKLVMSIMLVPTKLSDPTRVVISKSLDQTDIVKQPPPPHTHTHIDVYVGTYSLCVINESTYVSIVLNNSQHASPEAPNMESGILALPYGSTYTSSQHSLHACTHTSLQQELALCWAWLSVAGTQQWKVLLLQGFMYISVNLSFFRFYTFKRL